MVSSLEDFIGVWRISRRIEDSLGGDANFVGYATFERDGDALQYLEVGELTLAGAGSIRAERKYLWSELKDGSIQVQFADGRDFHTINVHEPEPRARHDCDPDVYEVTYGFEEWPKWSSRWRVQGPRKDYVMTSHYTLDPTRKAD